MRPGQRGGGALAVLRRGEAGWTTPNWAGWPVAVVLLFVPFPIDDLSQPFRRPSELRRLADAVRNAGDYDETRWIEWKSRLDLTSRPGQLHLVKQILGFANRDPDLAAQWAAGNAYLLVGVSPGELHGIAPVDPQRLSQALTPYIGPEVVWSPEYIRLEGADVLVVEVAAPRHGDTIHFLMKDFFVTKTVQTSKGPVDKSHGYHQGTILIRRHGETDRADDEERQMLLRRANSTRARLQVSVVSDAATIEAAPSLEPQLSQWVNEERARLLTARYRPLPQQPPTSAADIPARLAAAVASSMTMSRDSRTMEQYAAEIEAYLTTTQTVLRDSIAADLRDHPPAHLALTRVNPEERPFTGVLVTVMLDGTAVGIEPGTADRSSARRLPDPPVPYGTPQRPAFTLPDTYPRVRGSRIVPGLGAYVPRPRPPWRAEQHEGGLRILFDPVDLRPHAHVSLAPVPLELGPSTAGPLVVRWNAAGTDANGVMSGSIALTLVPSTLEPLNGLQAELASSATQME